MGKMLVMKKMKSWIFSEMKTLKNPLKKKTVKNLSSKGHCTYSKYILYLDFGFEKFFSEVWRTDTVSLTPNTGYKTDNTLTASADKIHFVSLDVIYILRRIIYTSWKLLSFINVWNRSPVWSVRCYLWLFFISQPLMEKK